MTVEKAKEIAKVLHEVTVEDWEEIKKAVDGAVMGCRLDNFDLLEEQLRSFPEGFGAYYRL